MSDLSVYPFEMRPLTADEDGGYLISYPDFSECIADGETVEEAIANGRAALSATIAALTAKDFPVPPPGRAVGCGEERTAPRPAHGAVRSAHRTLPTNDPHRRPSRPCPHTTD